MADGPPAELDLQSKVSGIPEGAIIGARKRPDGTLDVSHGAISLGPDRARAREIVAATKKRVTRENEEIRSGQVNKDIQPGSAEAIAQRLQNAIDMHRRAADRAETPIDTSSDRQRLSDQLRSERETLDKVIDMKALELVREEIDELTNRYGYTHHETPYIYQQSYKKAEKMSAGEAADRIDGLVHGWEETLPNTTDPQEAAKLEFQIKCARNLQVMLFDEEARIKQNTQSEKTQPTTDSQEKQPLQPTKQTETSTARATEVQQETQTPQERFEQRAKELAEATRREGIGQMYGFVYPLDKNILKGFAAGMGFDRGQIVQGQQNADPYQARALQKRIAAHFPPQEVRDAYDHQERQIWMMEQYHPDSNMQRITYDMYTESPYETRPGVGVMLNVVVPNELANQINAAVRENPNFADAYFKAIFPDVVGQDGLTRIRRKRATELLILDQRQNPRNMQGETIKFSQPIEY